MDLSGAALAGAAVGAAFGIVSALLVVSAVVERLRALDRSENQADRAVLERKILALRWIVVAIEATVFAILGYWVGSWLFA
jgi:gas vesicle protein